MTASCGWGLFAKVDLKEDAAIDLVGEVIPLWEAQEREQQYLQRNQCFLFSTLRLRDSIRWYAIDNRSHGNRQDETSRHAAACLRIFSSFHCMWSHCSHSLLVLLILLACSSFSLSLHQSQLRAQPEAVSVERRPTLHRVHHSRHQRSDNEQQKRHM